MAKPVVGEFLRLVDCTIAVRVDLLLDAVAEDIVDVFHDFSGRTADRKAFGDLRQPVVVVVFVFDHERLPIVVSNPLPECFRRAVYWSTV